MARNHHVLGAVNLAMDNLVQAESHLKRAYDLERGNLTLVRDYVKLLRLADRLEESRDLITQLMQQGGADPGLLMTLYSIQYRLGRKDEANAVLRQYIETYPDSPEALLELASSLYESRQLGAAVEMHQAVLAVQPDNAVAHYNLGAIEMGRLNYSAAETHLSRAIALDPGLAKARLNLGNVFFVTGRLDQARAEYDQARQLEPGNAVVLNNLGLVERRHYQQTGQPEHLERAKEFFRQAYERDAMLIEAMLNQALLLSRQGQYDEALGLLDRVVGIYGEEAPLAAVMARGYIRLEQGDFAAAEAEYRRVVRESVVQSQKNLGVNGLAVALYKQGRLDEALAQLDAVIVQEGDRSRPLALANRAMVQLSRDGPAPEIRAQLSESIQLEDLAEAHATLARLELLAGNLSEAVAESQAALALNEQLRGGHYNHALALERSGRLTEAEAAYRQELRYHPNFLEASLNLGLNLLAQNRLDEARQTLAEARQAHPNHPRVLLALALAHARRQENAEAGELARRAAQADPQLAAAQSLLAVLAARDNRLRDAERAALRAVELAPTSFYDSLNLVAIYALEGKFTDARLALDRTPDPGPDPVRRQRLLSTRVAVLVGMGLLERAREILAESPGLDSQPLLSRLQQQIDAVVERK